MRTQLPKYGETISHQQTSLQRPTVSQRRREPTKLTATEPGVQRVISYIAEMYVQSCNSFGHRSHVPAVNSSPQFVRTLSSSRRTDHSFASVRCTGHMSISERMNIRFRSWCYLPTQLERLIARRAALIATLWGTTINTSIVKLSIVGNYTSWRSVWKLTHYVITINTAYKLKIVAQY